MFEFRKNRKIRAGLYVDGVSKYDNENYTRVNNFMVTFLFSFICSNPEFTRTPLPIQYNSGPAEGE